MMKDHPTLTRRLAMVLCLILTANCGAQTVPYATTVSPDIRAVKLAEDRGAAGLEQTLRKLNSWASLMMITAHPDDEDGGLLTYESRGQGVRTALLTLTRGEGGQNAMSGESYDALGLIRTQELLRADEYYGAEQYWGTVADFGFSKTIEEAFSKWGHQRVLYDAVRAVRMNRPLVVLSAYVGGITDGHGQHQVAGEITQEVYKAAGDPKVFPDQIAAGLRPWSPRKVYARVPMFSIGSQGMFDDATGKWAPVRFYNYLNGTWSNKAPETNVQIPAGTYDPVLGRNYSQMAREGWGEQKTQNGGGFIPLSGPASTPYHLYGSRVNTRDQEHTFFDGLDTSLEGMADLAPGSPAFLHEGLRKIQQSVTAAISEYVPTAPERIAPHLRDGFADTRKLLEAVQTGSLSADAKADLTHELDIKLAQFNTALAEALGLEITVVRTSSGKTQDLSLVPGETPQSVVPNQSFFVRIHATSATQTAKLLHSEIRTPADENWKIEKQGEKSVTGTDTIFQVTVPDHVRPTEAYFSRPTIEQPYYDIEDVRWRNAALAPYPVSGWAEFDYDGVTIRIGGVAQSVHRVQGPGSTFEPLLVTPALGISLEPEGSAVPLGSKSFSIVARVHGQIPQEGRVHLKLPQGWTAEPESETFLIAKPGDEVALPFTIRPNTLEAKLYSIEAEAESGDHKYTQGWETAGYQGILPSNLYRPAISRIRGMDVKVTPGLRVGYVMGTGDAVPEALESLGISPHLLTDDELANGNLSAYDTIMIGIRAYTVRPALTKWNRRLMEYVEHGGNLVVQYQRSDFPTPYPLSLGNPPENVVHESAPVRLLHLDRPFFHEPNTIGPEDFNGWVEERGHSFADSWDPKYVALTETADPDQSPQRGGLLIASHGKGRYTYVAYALYRQLPEAVPGAYRLLANLISVQGSRH
jgi:LmbE family N-acetylglucosaminyl deacetylase